MGFFLLKKTGFHFSSLFINVIIATYLFAVEVNWMSFQTRILSILYCTWKTYLIGEKMVERWITLKGHKGGLKNNK